MTVSVESERQVHHPRIYITDATNSVALYTLSYLVRSQEELYIYFHTDSAEEEELVKRICPRAMKVAEHVAKGMERSVLFLREGMEEGELKRPVEGYHRFVLIVSMATGVENSSFARLEQLAKRSGYESYCLLRLAPIYQNLESIDPESFDIEGGGGEFFGIDAEDVGAAVSCILLDPELHRGEEYTIYCPTSIPLSTVKTVHSQLPKMHGHDLQSPSIILAALKSNYWRASGSNLDVKNDFGRITGGEEMTSFEEFLRRANQSLFHQRFIARH